MWLRPAPAPYVAQITRGLAPAIAIVAAVQRAAELSAPYELISQLGLCDAKNLAATRALAAGRDLMLLEDDVIAPRWPVHDAENVQVLAVHYPHAEGVNVQRDSRGRVLCAGTTAMRIPLAVLRKIPPPWFVARVIRTKNERLELGGPRDDDRGSDVYFCWLCQEHGVRITCSDHAISIKHELRGFPPSRMSAIPIEGVTP